MTHAAPTKSIVLYADDDPDDLQLVREAFEQFSANVEVVTARDGTEALSYLMGLSPLDPTPCLVVLDINMPRMDGKETLVRMRALERFSDVPVVMFTTSSQPLDRSFAERFSAGFITKPIDVRQMERITGEFIEHCTDEVKRTIRR